MHHIVLFSQRTVLLPSVLESQKHEAAVCRPAPAAQTVRQYIDTQFIMNMSDTLSVLESQKHDAAVCRACPCGTNGSAAVAHTDHHVGVLLLAQLLLLCLLRHTLRPGEGMMSVSNMQGYHSLCDDVPSLAELVIGH